MTHHFVEVHGCSVLDLAEAGVPGNPRLFSWIVGPALRIIGHFSVERQPGITSSKSADSTKSIRRSPRSGFPAAPLRTNPQYRDRKAKVDAHGR